MQEQRFNKKRRQLSTIKNIMKPEDFFSKIKSIKGRIIAVQNRFAFNDLYFIKILQRRLNVHKTCCMIGEKPKVKGGLEEVLNIGKIYEMSDSVQIQTDKNNLICQIRNLDVGPMYFNIPKIIINKDSVVVDNNMYSLKQVSPYATTNQLTLLEFKMIIIANIECVSINMNNSYIIYMKNGSEFQFNFDTPFGNISLSKLFYSPMLYYLYAVYTRSLYCYSENKTKVPMEISASTIYREKNRRKRKENKRNK
jgi:hypothetical protein